MLRALRHPLLVGTAEVLADAVRYVAIMLFVLLLLRQARADRALKRQEQTASAWARGLKPGCAVSY